MNYIEYDFKVEPRQPASDILVAQLGEIGFESFMESETGILAYIQKDDFREDDFKKVGVLEAEFCKITFTNKEIEQVNWNEEWEKNFNPIFVDEKCCIRAPFHAPCNLEYEIIVEPKMSFGTGHHETTYMMIQHLLKQDLGKKSVLDMGCGTAVLTILAEKLGATRLDAIDINNWCYLNSIENIERNKCKSISVFEGDVDLIENKTYDLIIANINRNILLQHISHYAKSLNKPGVLLLSGFYDNDVEAIEAECSSNMLKLTESLEKNNWVSLKFIN